MQIHISPRIDEGELPARMNPGSGDPFGIISFGTGYSGADLTVSSDEDADRIIRAAAKIKAMRAMIGTPHPFTSSVEYGPQGGHCDLCGLLGEAPDHAAVLAEPVVIEAPVTAASDIQPSPWCECSHGRLFHDLVTPNGCLRKECGCTRFRPRVELSSPEPPAVVPGTVERERAAVTA